MNTKPDYLGHRQRIKEKYFKNGLDGLADYEILELILTLNLARKDTKPLAKQLLTKFKTLTNILEASKDDLLSVTGAGPQLFFILSLIKDTAKIYLKNNSFTSDIVDSPKKIYNYLIAHYNGLKNETFLIISLNNSNKIITLETISTGTINKATIYPRTIVEKALKTNAAAIIIVHNHPSGNTTPSAADISLTQKIKTALNTLDIPLLDHLIIAQNNYISFKEQDLL